MYKKGLKRTLRILIHKFGVKGDTNIFLYKSGVNGPRVLLKFTRNRELGGSRQWKSYDCANHRQFSGNLRGGKSGRNIKIGQFRYLGQIVGVFHFSQVLRNY